MGISEKPSRGVPPELLGHSLLRVRALTTRKKTTAAEETVTARDGERHDDSVTHRELRHTAADPYNFSHRLVSDDVAARQRRDEAAVAVQVGSADRGRCDSNDRIARMLDLRVGNGLESNVTFT